jgi:hypothetical protein
MTVMLLKGNYGENGKLPLFILAIIVYFRFLYMNSLETLSSQRTKNGIALARKWANRLAILI